MKGQPVQASSRTMFRMRRRVGAALAVPLIVGAIGGLTGCGAQRPGVAAQVGDRIITTAEVEDVVTQANQRPAAGEQNAQPMTQQNALTALMLAPYVARELTGAGKAVSEDQAVRQVFPSVGRPSEALRKVAQFQLGAGNLSADQGNKVLSDFATDGYEINPRYGTLTLPQGWSAAAPNWMVSGSGASPSAGPQ